MTALLATEVLKLRTVALPVSRCSSLPSWRR